MLDADRIIPAIDEGRVVVSFALIRKGARDHRDPADQPYAHPVATRPISRHKAVKESHQ
ncbi:MAG: hypothetical protein P4L71_16545 [Acetobacteraceae bacterium]|nr:hypothetical protein [Acetobacteraceae bacterium]